MNKEKKLIELKSLVEAAELSLQRARKILTDLVGTEEEKMLLEQAKKSTNKTVNQQEEGLVLEGVFDGQNMIGADGKKYSVPANYASKSKLVEGDGLKLTILQDGTFVYKQINPLERQRLIGELIIDEESGEYRVLTNNKAYKVLNASITYFKGEPGDRITLLVPKHKESSWAAVENIFKPGDEGYVEDIDKENARLQAEERDRRADLTEVGGGQVESEQGAERNNLDLNLSTEQPAPPEKDKLDQMSQEPVNQDNKSAEQELSIEDEGDEFLAADESEKQLGQVDDQQNLTQEEPATPIPADIISHDLSPEEKQSQDIFEAVEQTNTDGVKQVDIDGQEPGEEQVMPNQQDVGDYGQEKINKNSQLNDDASNDDLNAVKDNQGLEDF